MKKILLFYVKDSEYYKKLNDLIVNKIQGFETTSIFGLDSAKVELYSENGEITFKINNLDFKDFSKVVLFLRSKLSQAR